MNIRKIYLVLNILLLSKLSFSMEGDLNHLSWLELAQMELHNASKKKERKKNTDSDSIELFKRIPKIAFKDIKGDIPEEITRIVHRIKNSEYYKQCGLDDTAHEVLLVGPPGTGKSSLAEAIATETGRDFYKLPASSLITSYQGSGSGNIRAIFEYVRRAGKPSVIFIDEVDGISNSDIKSNTGESDRTVKELQVQLDFQDPLIICILATNNFEQLSGAIKDRFAHKTINVPLPNYGKRLAILKYYAETQKLNVSKDFISKLAKLTEQLSCRNLEKLSDEAFNIAFEEQFDSIKRTLDKEKEKESETKAEQPFEIKDIDYLVATYTTQNTKLPSLSMRVELFNYFFKKKDLLPQSRYVVFLANKTESFASKDIKMVVDNIRSIYDEKKVFGCLDMYAGLYYDQRINFADSFMRKILFEYYLNGEKNISFKHCTKEELCSILAYYTEDNFIGKEIREIVGNASEMAEVENSSITEKHLVIALYKQLMKKSKPYVITTSLKVHKNDMNRSMKPSDNIKELITPIDERPGVQIESFSIRLLQDNEKFIESISFDSPKYIKTRLDYRTKLQPNWVIRYILTEYFLEDISHCLSSNQINSLAKSTEGLSWYSLEQLIKLAKDHAIGTCSKKLEFKHLITAAHEFDIKLIDSAAQDGCIIS